MGRGGRRLEIVSPNCHYSYCRADCHIPVPSLGTSLLAGALCRLLSEAWLRGSMLVKSTGRKVCMVGGV